jgi:HAE1 family hydrophobic/amphiphilic exporter-1
MYKAIEKAIDGTLEAYKVSLRWSLKHRRPMIAFTLVILVAMVVMFAKIPKGFIPSEDTGQFNIITEAAQGISWDAMVRHQQAVAQLVAQDPDIGGFSSSLGGVSAANSGRMFLIAKPRAERKSSVDAIIERLRPKVNGVTGINVFLQNPPPVQVGGRVAKSLYQFTLQSPDTDELYRYAAQFETKIRALSNLQDVTSDMQLKNPQVTVQIDRDMAQAKGVSAMQIEDALYYSYGQRQVSTIYTANNQYWVIVELDPRFQSDPALLSKLYVSSSKGTLIPLDSVAKLTRTLGPLSVNHSGQLPSVTISFNLKPGVSLGDAVNEITRLARETLPSTVSTNFQGTAQAFQSSLQGLGVLLIMTILVIYIILGILYESFVHPLTILSALPFAGFGALATLMIFRTELSIYGYVGIIMLVGLVKKNGIMMIDFALSAQRDEGKNAFDSIFEACVIRFRPIMMTTMATLFGTLPIALGFGAGAEARRPLGLAVVGGLLFSQLVTLYVTPVIYTYLDRLTKKSRERAALAA